MVIFAWFVPGSFLALRGDRRADYALKELK